MEKHRFYSLDFIFLYISILLIAWMGFSYYVEIHTNDSYAVTKRVRVGYELRDYKPEVLIGDKVTGEKHSDMWRSAGAVSDRLANSGVSVELYPFFVRENAEGQRYVFFVPEDGQLDVKGFEYAAVPKDAAFLEFTWYPIDQYIQRNYETIVNALVDEQRKYNRSELWVEVRSPWYLIPFMMHNGVFVEILE